MQDRAPAPRSLSVLLVEDNEINRMVARAVLEGGGHRVTEAADGAQAVTTHAAHAFDCVLMDCQMPVLDGQEATRRIRAHETSAGARRTPIVALTANTMQGDREHCLAAGMDEFLAKPYDSAALLEMVTRVTAGAAPAAESPTGVAGDECFDAGGLEGLVRLEEDSPGILGNLVRRFLSNTPGLIAQVAGDAPASVKDTEIAAHSLKSTCARFGAVRVTALAAQAERAARDGALSEAQHLGALIRLAYDQFEVRFRQHPAVAEVIGNGAPGGTPGGRG